MRIREDKDANYKAIFFNHKTVRMRIDNSKPITVPKTTELEDVAINSKCLANCSYCYVSAVKSGSNFDNIIEKADLVYGSLDLKDRPFQIAIGGAGEPTMHPQFNDFVKHISELNIVPNYTTNGMHITKDILEYTEKYCGGVAISYHPHIKKVFHNAIEQYKTIKTKLNVHIIIGEESSLNDLKEIVSKYIDDVEYFVLLPYQNAGRAKELETNSIFSEMFSYLETLDETTQKKFAFGALFYEYLLKYKPNLKMSIYEPEIYSGYRLLDDSYNLLRKSSYDLNPKFN